ncbi:NERD domain-containing protein [Streptomyces mirabilis]|uniref:NERD domain-containing protein n=1 Tax=Streptomyces mirabilis TaxID=68239 RepID=UPI00369F0621
MAATGRASAPEPGTPGPQTPKPGPPRPAQQWFQDRPSPYPWEQDALDHVRHLMPRAEPYRAWSTFSFTAQSGRVNECDLLIAVPAGLFLVEIKSHPGQLGYSWITPPRRSCRRMSRRAIRPGSAIGSGRALRRVEVLPAS